MNIHMIHGRLVRDPDYVREADETRSRAKFTVAVDRSYGDEADFIDCIVWGKRAATIDKWFHKGKEIAVSGEGRTGSYTDKNGTKHKTYTINVNQFDFCGSSKDSAQAATKLEQDAAALLMPDTMEKQEEDIPF